MPASAPMKAHPATPENATMDRCDHWTPTRCNERGTHWLYAPDGKLCPGGPLCERHGREIVEEYREKLGEPWTLERGYVCSGIVFTRQRAEEMGLELVAEPAA